MILRSNIAKLQEICRDLPTVLDVGGWHNPFNLATHVLDIMPYETRRTHEALDPEDAERFSEDTWLIHDACAGNWPWPDDYFDFSICSHTLEDVRDPIVITSELARVSKSGYIEVPSWAREIFIKDRFWRLRMIGGKSPEIGFPHHRWLCELNDGELHFYQKDAHIGLDRKNYISRADLGRKKMTESEAGIGIFWNDTITAREIIVTSDTLLAEKREQILGRLRQA
ncbi:MAG: methyltransferase domain-containing protein [Alphaproteobacteria bacterium]